MKYRLAIVCVLLACPAVSAQPASKPTAAKAPETLLAADSLVYLRYDGFERHRDAYAKTALAKVMKDDLGEFFEYLGAFLLRQFANEIRPGDGNPAQVQKQREKILAEMHGFTDYLWRHGVAVGIEVPDGRGLQGPRNLFFPDFLPGLSIGGGQLTLVFPEGATKAERERLFSFFRTFATLGGGEVKEKKVQGRTIHEIPDAPVGAAWWQEGEHIVCYLGTEPVERALDVITGKRPNLASTALQRSVAAFNRYETDIRGYVDLQKTLALWRAPENKGDRLAMLKEAFIRRAVFTHLGLDGLKSLTFHLGFDRQYQRSTVVLNVAEPAKRTGLLRLVASPLDYPAEKLPPLPPDAACVSIRQVDWGTTYDVVTGLLKLIEMGTALNENRWPPKEITDLDQVLGGIDLRKELLGALDSTVVTYNALSEGPFIIGQGVAVKVKDAKKVQIGLQALSKALVRLAGGNDEASFRKVAYRGVDLYTFAGARDLPIPLTYTVHQGWLVIGVFPQSVKGYILRSEGKHKVWQAPPLTAEVLGLAQKGGSTKSKLSAVTVTDPRPAVEVGLAVLPTIVQIIQSFDRGGERPFDVTKIPNAQAVTEWLFPGVTVLHDDGEALRWESHFSILSVDESFAPALLFFGSARWVLH